MSYPQGINFRNSAPYVTDGADEDCELAASGIQTYPRTTLQGNTVGWETVGTFYQSRDRNSGNDRRIAGLNRYDDPVPVDFRFDLDSVGARDIGTAMGDGSYAQVVDCELFDGSSSLGVLCSGSTGAANSFKDATNTIHTAANYAANHATVSKTFATLIARFRYGTTGTVTSHVAHAFVGALSSAATSLLPSRAAIAPLLLR